MCACGNGDGNRCMKKVIQSILYAANISGEMVVRRVCICVCFSVIDAVLIVETECALIEYVIQASNAIC